VSQNKIHNLLDASHREVYGLKTKLQLSPSVREYIDITFIENGPVVFEALDDKEFIHL